MWKVALTAPEAHISVAITLQHLHYDLQRLLTSLYLWNTASRSYESHTFVFGRYSLSIKMFRMRTFLTSTMPKPSPRAQLPHSDAQKTSRCIPKILRRMITSAPNNEILGRKMSVRKLLESLPKREHDADRQSSACSIRARKVRSRRNGHSVVVFKRTGTGKDRSPCGLSNCSRCGVFWSEYLDPMYTV